MYCLHNLVAPIHQDCENLLNIIQTKTFAGSAQS